MIWGGWTDGDGFRLRCCGCCDDEGGGGGTERWVGVWPGWCGLVQLFRRLAIWPPAGFIDCGIQRCVVYSVRFFLSCDSLLQSALGRPAPEVHSEFRAFPLGCCYPTLSFCGLHEVVPRCILQKLWHIVIHVSCRGKHVLPGCGRAKVRIFTFTQDVRRYERAQFMFVKSA